MHIILWLLLTPLVFSVSSASAQINASVGAVKTQKIYQSIETSRGVSQNYTWIETIENNQRKISLNGKPHTEVVYGNTATTKWQYSDSDIAIDVTVTNNQAVFVANKNGETIEKSFDLGNDPMLFPPSFFMREFVSSDEKRQFIWLINQGELNVSKMVLTKLEQESVEINELNIDCQKIEMKPTGLAGLVWKAYYWFDIKTGDFIKYEGLKGPPGSALFTIEAIIN